MRWPENYKKAFKAYRNGFAFGVFAGLVSWIFIGKPVYTLPLISGMLFGAVAFQIRLRKEIKNNAL